MEVLENGGGSRWGTNEVVVVRHCRLGPFGIGSTNEEQPRTIYISTPTSRAIITRLRGAPRWTGVCGVGAPRVWCGEGRALQFLPDTGSIHSATPRGLSCMWSVVFTFRNGRGGGVG